jgi:hypothetical protein
VLEVLTAFDVLDFPAELEEVREVLTTVDVVDFATEIEEVLEVLTAFDVLDFAAELEEELEVLTTVDVVGFAAELEEVVEIFVVAMELEVERLEVEDDDIVLEAFGFGNPYPYTSSLLGPPQYSEALPAQIMLHPVDPSGAGPPPLEKTLPQSVTQN